MIQQIENLDKDSLAQVNVALENAAYVHRHLDWKPPQQWLGSSPFLAVTLNGAIRSTLAVPAGDEDVAWIRVFASTRLDSMESDWQVLLTQTVRELMATPCKMIVAIAIADWFQRLLRASSFTSEDHIINLELEIDPLTYQPVPITLSTRTINAMPVDELVRLDHAAFDPLWHLTQSDFEIAFEKNCWGLVAMEQNQPVGYLLCVPYPKTIHLARLAVLPDHQRRGIGYQLIHTMFEHYIAQGCYSFGVNTSSDNLKSLHLYRYVGFRSSGTEYPIYKLRIH